jgi:cytochrome c biogenesis protein
LSYKKSLIWSFFSSVRLTIFLLIIIAVLSVIGTIIPQQESAQEFIQSLSPGTAGLLSHLQLFDIYHSVTFFILMALLSVNLVVCSWNRFPSSLKQFKKSPQPVPEGLFDKAAEDNAVLFPDGTENINENLSSFLKKKLGDPEKSESGQTSFFFFEKNRFSQFGVYVVHLSILLIIAGVVIGSVKGFEGYVNILEGDSVQTIDLRGGKGTKKLDFFVRCDRFTVDYYDNGAPRTYRSDLSFIKDSRILKQGPLLVNHPLEHDNIRFYQSSYGQMPNGRAFVTYRTGKENEKGMMLQAGDRINLPDSNAVLEVLRLEANIMEMGPAMKLRITSPKADVQFWIFKRIEEMKIANPGVIGEVPLFNPGLFKPYVFSLVRLEEQFYTGLQVVSDPGVPLVAAGGFLMMAGLIVVFFFPHQRVWARIDESEGKARVTFIGRSRNRSDMRRQLERIISEMKQELKQ